MNRSMLIGCWVRNVWYVVIGSEASSVSNLLPQFCGTLRRQIIYCELRLRLCKECSESKYASPVSPVSVIAEDRFSVFTSMQIVNEYIRSKERKGFKDEVEKVRKLAISTFQPCVIPTKLS